MGPDSCTAFWIGKRGSRIVPHTLKPQITIRLSIRHYFRFKRGDRNYCSALFFCKFFKTRWIERRNWGTCKRVDWWKWEGWKGRGMAWGYWKFRWVKRKVFRCAFNLVIHEDITSKEYREVTLSTCRWCSFQTLDKYKVSRE